VTPHHFTLSDYVDTERIVIAKFQNISPSTRVDSESRSQATVTDSTSSTTTSAAEDDERTRGGPSMPVISDVQEEVRPQVRRSEIPVPGLNVHSLPTSPPPTLNFHTPDSSPETSKPGIRNYRKPGIASSKRPGIGSQMKWDSLHGGTYRYNPLGLGEIRVLHLLAGKKDDQIHCAFSPIQIRNVNAGNAIPNYHAVSYYWEDKPPLDEIQIFTGTHQFEATYETLVIRPTLSTALRRLRDEQKIVLLWIDALCINQNDDEEKTVQVVMIPQIIYKACHVCVWLGEDANGSETMHTFLPKLLDLTQVDRIVEKESTPEQWQAFPALMMRA